MKAIAKSGRRWVNQRIEGPSYTRPGKGNVWYFDGQYRPWTGEVRISNLYGDIVDVQGYSEALRAFVDAIDGLAGVPIVSAGDAPQRGKTRKAAMS